MHISGYNLVQTLSWCFCFIGQFIEYAIHLHSYITNEGNYLKATVSCMKKEHTTPHPFFPLDIEGQDTIDKPFDMVTLSKPIANQYVQRVDYTLNMSDSSDILLCIFPLTF